MAKKNFEKGRPAREMKDYIAENQQISIRHQCEILDVNRSTVYYEPVGESEENLEVMRMMGMMAIYPRGNLSRMGSAKYLRPYLLKGIKITRPNQVWAIDITYLPMAHGFCI